MFVDFRLQPAKSADAAPFAYLQHRDKYLRGRHCIADRHMPQGMSISRRSQIASNVWVADPPNTTAGNRTVSMAGSLKMLPDLT
ncbi:MAG: hypothetical protein Q4P24_04940 [Rhodobacterales bacterium]|nr:hypothetical protein [Rhodobacterales bacterium]